MKTAANTSDHFIVVQEPALNMQLRTIQKTTESQQMHHLNVLIVKSNIQLDRIGIVDKTQLQQIQTNEVLEHFLALCVK